ncbi:MAG: adenylate/guanylate cyclase domain-containing protein [Actinobacteria bacterium 13_2_20CM_2_66_6]|nr:MAG: adenylate/guanylate cyclase domain-containing protein [Actinobacteria bacterium 13_2_20CM_2_66_6]
MSRHPVTRYAKSGEYSIAYQIVGDSPLDLVYVPGFVSHVEAVWEDPDYARFLDRLASFSRLIIFDKRGTGLSDRVPVKLLPTLEERMDDVRAVMDAAGSERAALFGVSEGGPMSMLFATTYPERVAALALYGTYAKRVRAADYPWAPTLEEHQDRLDVVERDWGGPVDLEAWAPSNVNDERFKRWWAQYLRLGASPAAARAVLEMTLEIDVRDILPAIRVPTLVMHRTGDRRIDVGGSRYLAERIPNAHFVELDGVDHLIWVGDYEAVAEEIGEFLTGTRQAAEPSRVLATVLFTDMVESTSRAVALGDARWRALISDHDRLVRAQLARFRGREIDRRGDGFLAIFDGPARAIRCALSIIERVHELGIQVRAGLHTGELDIIESGVAGIAVHTGARVMSLAGADEVLITSTVRDLVAGSGLSFSDRGIHELKGVPGSWRILRVEPDAS